MDPPSQDRFLPLLLWGLWTPMSMTYTSSISSLPSRDRVALAVSMAATEGPYSSSINFLILHAYLQELCVHNTMFFYIPAMHQDLDLLVTTTYLDLTESHYRRETLGLWSVALSLIT